MSEIRTNTRVKEIAMSYQSYLESIRSTSNPMPSSKGSPSTSPHAIIHRKPPANYSPMPNTPVSSYRSVTQPVVRNPSLSSSAAPTSSTNAPPTPTSVASQLAPAPSATPAPPLPGALTQEEIDLALRACLEVQMDAVKNHDKRPFSALLLAPDNSKILQTHFSISHVQHAESELARLASLQYSMTYLSKCTLVSTWEPCAMCSGTIYWSGIGRVLYAASESKLKELTGPNNKENMTMDLPCRTVFSAGQRRVEAIGPVREWEERVVQESGKWWKDHMVSNRARSVSSVGVDSTNGSMSTGVVVVHSEDPTLGKIGEDGEYQADLKVDWMF